MNPRIRDLLLGWAITASLGVSGFAHAQGSEPLAAGSVSDSMTVDRPDSLGLALPDTLDATVADSLFVAPPDSVAVTPADSLEGRRSAAADSTAREDETFHLLDREARMRRMRPTVVGRATLDWRRPETVEGVVESVPGASVRVAGDVGMRSWFAISPVGFRAPEIWSDGIPSRSPGDLDPAIWDRSSIAVDGVGTSAHDLGPIGGDPHVRLERRAPVAGRTLLDSRFSSAAFETFHRAVSVTTPATDRVVRLEFEDWKTDEGYEYSNAPNVLASGLRGRSAMRRFRFGTDFGIEDARVRFTFGRGRRYHRGDALGVESHERWTGEVGLVVDHFGESAVQSVAAWHLDFHDDERAFDQQTDAARQGVRWQRRPDGAGWGFDATVERWAMQTTTDDTVVVRADPSRVVRVAGLVQGDRDARWWPWLRLEVADAEHAADVLAVGGRAGVRARVGAKSAVSGYVSRDLRTPTLLETDGARRFRTVTPVGGEISYVAREFTWEARRRLDFEREERAGVALETPWLGFAIDGAVELWRLRDGIGWIADGDTARVVGERELEAVQLRGRVQRAFRFGSAAPDWRVRVLAQGQIVVDEATPDASRGVGYPRWQSRSRIGIDRTFFSVRNRIGIDVEVFGRGTARDDALGSLGTVAIPAMWDVSARAWLRVRDAEMSLNLDNALDRRLDEVAGTTRRAQQIRWQLVWPFFN